jgi:hypothetical protein
MRVVVTGALPDVVSQLVGELGGRGHDVTVAEGTSADAVVRVVGPHLITLVSSGLMVRTATILGRDSVGVTQRRFAVPVILGARHRGNGDVVQFVHHDDATR